MRNAKRFISVMLAGILLSTGTGIRTSAEDAGYEYLPDNVYIEDEMPAEGDPGTDAEGDIYIEDNTEVPQAAGGDIVIENDGGGDAQPVPPDTSVPETAAQDVQAEAPRNILEYTNEEQDAVHAAENPDPKLTIRLEGEKDFPDPSFAWVEVLHGGEVHDLEAAVSEHLQGAYNVTTAFSVWMAVMNEYGEERHSLGKTKVSLYYEKALDLEDTRLFHLRTDSYADETGAVHEEQTWEELSYEIYEDQTPGVTDQMRYFISFETDGFSPFVFAKTEEIPAEAIDTEAPSENEPADVGEPAGEEVTQEEQIPEEEMPKETTSEETVPEIPEETDTDPQEETADISDGEIAADPETEAPKDDGTEDETDSAETEIITTEDTEPEAEADTPEETAEDGESAEEADISEDTEEPENTEEKDAAADEGEVEDLTALPLVETAESKAAGELSMFALSPRTLAQANGLLAAAPSQEPVSEDGMTIEKITIKWLSKSTGSSVAAGYDTLELMPTTENVANQQWQIDFALSGKHEHEAGSIEVVMPAYIWLDRDGQEPGRLTLAVPEDPTTGADFTWRRVGDSIVFTNIKNISAASKVMIQGTFRDVNAVDMVDVDVDPESAYAASSNTGLSDPLSATINLVVPNGNVISMTSNEIYASINTRVEAASASKTAYDATAKEYYMWWDVPSQIPAEFLPENPENYAYVRWFVSGQAEGNQPFTMTVTDTSSGEYGCLMLGVQDAQGVNVPSPDGVSVSAQLFDGFNRYVKSAYVWTAYDKSYFTEPFQLYTVHNTQTITVTGWDDMIPTQREASAEVSIAMPIEYTVVKEWDDDDNALGLRPDGQAVSIYRNTTGNNYNNIWKTVTLVENPTPEQVAQGYGPWSYTWSDEGKAWHYETAEHSFAHGTFDVYYDLNGVRHTRAWSYRQKSKTYDPDAREWKYVNTLGTAGTDGDVSDMRKRVFSQYDQPYIRATSDRALNLLMHGQEAIVPYNVYGTAGNFDHWQNGERFDVILEDYLDMLNNHRITLDDYDLAWVDISRPSIYGYTPAVKDPSLPEDDPEKYYEDRVVLAPYTDAEMTAKFYALLDGEWIQVGELNGTRITAMNGAVADGLRLYLPENTAQFREEVNTDAAVTDLHYAIGVRIKPSEYVLTQIENASKLSDYMMMTVDNYAKMKVVYEGETEQELSDWDRGYLHGRLFRVAAWQKKDFVVTDNDLVRQKIIIHTTAKVTQQSNAIYREDYDLAVNNGDIPFTEGGTWYDLLPIGIRPLTDTVRLQNGDQILDAYTIEDYKGTGRVLLVVKAKLADHVSYTSYNSTNPHAHDPSYPESGFKQEQVIEFDCEYDWEDAQKYGIDTVRNTIAFETDDEWIGNQPSWSGENDNPTDGGNKWSEEETADDTEVMAGLNEDCETPSFIYAGADLRTDELDFAAETSIRKWVAPEGGTWSYGHHNEAIVYEGGKYTYRIAMRSESETMTKNIVILDSLENYVPQASDTADYGDGQWKGHLISIDTSQLEEMGVAPVVYYSTVPNLDLYGYNPSNMQGEVINMLQTATDDLGNLIWSTTPPENMGDVTAFAIDCRHKADGSDFELSSDAAESEDNTVPTLMFHLNMRAPAQEEAEPAWDIDGMGDPTNPDNNAHAYNNVFLDSTQVDGIGRETHAYIFWNYVKVGIVPFNLDVTKEWNDMNDNDGKRPESVTVRLIRDGEDTGESLVLDESNNWHGVFEHVLRYDFDKADDGHYINYTFEEDTTPEYEMSYVREDNRVTVVNTHIPEKTEVTINKTWDDGGADTRPASITVRLLKDGVLSDVYVIRPDKDGNWSKTITGLYKYENGREIVYTAEEERVDNYLSSYDGTDIVNTYYPKGDLTVRKTLVDATAAASNVDFTFTILLTDPHGEGLMDRYEYETSDGRTGRIGNGGTITLKGGQSITISDIPAHTRYEVVESSKKGFVQESVTGETGEILTGVPAEAEFTNRYSSTGQAPIEASKTLNGSNIQRYQFHFEMMEGEFTLSEEDGTVIARTSNTADGNIRFSGAKFTQKDDGKEFYYKIREVDRQKDGYIYDDAWFTVKITPHDNGDGTMSFDTVYYDSEGNELESSEVYVFPDRFEIAPEEWDALNAEEKQALAAQHQAPSDEPPASPVMPTLTLRRPAVFKNEYEAEGEITLRSWKKLEGRALQAEEFTFGLYDENGNLLQTKKNGADGTITWDPISFNQDNVGWTYRYYVREYDTGDPTVTYTDAIYGYSVKVIDNCDGTLGFEERHINPETEAEGCEACGETGYLAPVTLTGDGTAECSAMLDQIKARIMELTDADPQSEQDAYTYEGADSELAALYGQLAEYLETELPLPRSHRAHYAVDTATGIASCEPACGECDGAGYVPHITGWDTENEGEFPLFVNSLKPGTLVVRKQTQWEEGMEPPDPNQKFHFKIRLINTEGKPLDDVVLEYEPELIENIGEIQPSPTPTPTLAPLPFEPSPTPRPSVTPIVH